MSVPRYYAGTATLKGDILAADLDGNVALQGDFIVSVGGYDGTDDTDLSSVDLGRGCGGLEGMINLCTEA